MKENGMQKYEIFKRYFLVFRQQTVQSKSPIYHNNIDRDLLQAFKDYSDSWESIKFTGK